VLLLSKKKQIIKKVAILGVKFGEGRGGVVPSFQTLGAGKKKKGKGIELSQWVRD
jgi:hypothetical protein